MQNSELASKTVDSKNGKTPVSIDKSQLKGIGLPTIHEISVDDIVVEKGHRQLRAETVVDLVDSMHIRQLQPIVVTPPREADGKHRLVCGAHRLEAARRLEWITIQALVRDGDEADLEMMTIDENLVRSEMTVLERGEALARKKVLHEARYGGAPKLGRPKKNSETISPFAKVAAADLGVSERTITDELAIAALPKPVRNAIRGTEIADTKTDLNALVKVKDPELQKSIAIKAAKAAKKKTGRRSVSVKELLRQHNLERLKKKIAAHKPPKGEYSVLIADSGKPYENRKNDETHRGRVPYPTMTLEELKAYPVPAAKDAVLGYWTTSSHMEESFDVIREWGFEPTGLIVTWVKSGPGTGHWLRSQTEHCIIAVKGSPRRVPLTKQSTVIYGDSGAHSEKPDGMHRILEEMCPGQPKTELFARRPHVGWDCTGPELPADDAGPDPVNADTNLGNENAPDAS